MAGEAFGRTGRLVVDVWSDIMCPWCYLGDSHLAAAVERFVHADAVDVRYHSYQLMPELSADEPADLLDILVARKGFPREQAEAMNDQMAERGRPLGLEYRFDKAVAINTRRAHQLTHLASRHGRQHDMVIRLFKAYFTDGLNVGDIDTLADLAAEVGLDRQRAHDELSSGVYESQVDADIRQAAQLGITGVPFFVFGGKYALSGAQPVEAFLQALTTSWDELAHQDVPAAL